MKKYIIITSLLLCSKISAQTNLDLEDWSPQYGIENPDGWATMNLFAGLNGDSVSCFRTTDAYWGKSAAKLRPIQVNLGQVYTFPGTIVQIVAANNRPKSFRFAYKYFSATKDTAYASLAFYKGNTKDTNNLIGRAEYKPDTTGQWKYVVVDIKWKSLLSPDTLIFGFNTGRMDMKSWLYVDDISISDYGAGAQPVAMQNDVIKITSTGTILCSDALTKGQNTLRIFNTSGSLVGLVNLQSQKNVPENLAGGLYYYTIANEENGMVVAQGKFFLAPR